jgi:regulator of sigma E protease
MLSVIGFLIILAPLVVVHEFGHFFFAKLFGVKAEIFSIGFGPRLFAKQYGETEFRVSLIPLGGYVKLLGEERDAEMSPEDARRSLHKQAAWKRFFIFFGGPLFNFLWAILVFMVMLAVGEPQLASVAGRVVPGSVAAKAGFVSGDKIVSIDGKPIRKFEELMTFVADSPDRALKFQVVSPGNPAQHDVVATPVSEDGYSMYGESARVGEIDGLLPTARATFVGVSDPGSLAAKAGIETGDQVTDMNGSPVASWEEIEARYAKAAPGSPLVFKITKVKTRQTIDFSQPKTESTKTLGDALGLRSTELFVEKVVKDSPAEKAGVHAGDRLIGVSGTEVQSFMALKDAVQHAGEKEGKVGFSWERAGQKMTASVVPTATSARDPLLKKVTQYTVGVMPMLTFAEPETVIERILNPFTLVYAATERMILFSWRNLVSVGKMFTGDVSVATLGGPIMIGKIAGESLSRGLHAFLSTMALLSIGLGVLNVLPVPVLDGGHLLLLGLESIRGKPLSIRQMEIVQQVGLSLILLLMVVVIRNDIARLPFFE